MKERTLYFNWGEDGPIPDFPTDNFSARFTRTSYFPEGIYRFTSRTDDGVRVWVDDTPVIDQWHLPFMAAVDHKLTAGNHTVKMEYREQSGSAHLQLSWPAVSLTVCPTIADEATCDGDPACRWSSCPGLGLCLPRYTAEPAACACAPYDKMECDANHNRGCGWFECRKKCLVTGMSIYSVCGGKEGTP